MKLKIVGYLFFAAFLLPTLTQAQLVTITGKIVDRNNGESLEYANIFESISKIGTISNANGYFKLQLKEGELKLNVTNAGFKDFSQNLILEKDTVLTVRLEPQPVKKNRSKANPDLQVSTVAVK